MFGIDTEVLTRVAGNVLTGEAAGKLVLAGATGAVIGFLTWLAQRFNKRDAAAPPPPPAAMGFVMDGDTAMALLREAKAIRSDLEQWRSEDAARAKDHEIADLRAQLATASGTTHGNQADIRADIDELKRMMAEIKLH